MKVSIRLFSLLFSLLLINFVPSFTALTWAETGDINNPEQQAPTAPVAPAEPVAVTAPELTTPAPAKITAPAKVELAKTAPVNIAPAPLLTVASDSHEARWHPIHFKPAIDQSTNAQCLSCHENILKDEVLKVSPAGVKASESLAWYQTLDVYEGEQQTFHQRHLTSKVAKELMDLKCSTCHQGHDPSIEISYLIQSKQVNQDIGKLVKPEVCWMCHGGFDPKTMPGVAGQWAKVRDLYNNDCMICHTIFRTKRHQVNYLKPEAIEKAGKTKNDSCYGCHGGRAWYQKTYPYARNTWDGMTLDTPDWAKNRPTKSEARFLIGVDKK